MKLKSKNLKTSFFYIIIPIVLASILGFILYQSNQRIETLKSGIDLKPRPFSELLATDFADVKDEVADPSKCDGSKIMKFLEAVKQSKSPEFLEAAKNSKASMNRFKDYDLFKDYDPNVHKLTILDDCWRQYENEYVRFKFRDLNGSLRMNEVDYFEIFDDSLEAFYAFGIGVIKINDFSIEKNIIEKLKGELATVKNIKIYKNPIGVEIYRADTIHLTYKYEDKSYYFIDLPDYNKYISIMSYSDRIAKDILSTIEIKK